MINLFLYVGLIVLSNVLAANILIPIGFGLVVPAGVFVFAPIFTIRDQIHRTYGWKTVSGLVLVSSVLSYLVSMITNNEVLGRIAVASVVAFLVSELVDTLIYQKYLHQSWMSRVLKSNAVSSFLDSFIFVGLAFGIIWPIIFGQYVIKMIISTLVGLYLGHKNNELGKISWCLPNIKF